MRRIFASLVLGYVVLALFTKPKEAAGPQFHHNPGLEAWKKRHLEAGE